MVPQLSMEHKKESGKKDQLGRFKEGKKVAGGRTEEGWKAESAGLEMRVVPPAPPEDPRVLIDAPIALPKHSCVWVQDSVSVD